MSAPFIIPFNNNPSSTSIKTTAYTIPAGKYARVKNLHGDLTIDTVPHYVIVSSFSRTTSTSGSYDDYIWCDDSIEFIKATKSSTVSNALNVTSVTYNVGNFYNAFLNATTTNASYSSSFGFYNDASFTGTRVSYFSPPKKGTTLSIANNSASATWLASQAVIYGLNFATNRTSGTMTHSAFAAYFDNGEFWVASGTVLDGVKFLVTEYNQIS